MNWSNPRSRRDSRLSSMALLAIVVNPLLLIFFSFAILSTSLSEQGLRDDGQVRPWDFYLPLFLLQFPRFCFSPDPEHGFAAGTVYCASTMSYPFSYIPEEFPPTSRTDDHLSSPFFIWIYRLIYMNIYILMFT